MIKRIILAVLMMASLSVKAQSWLQMGNTLQRQSTTTGTNWRFNLGSPGFMSFYSKQNIDSLFAPLNSNGFIRNQNSSAQTANGWINGSFTSGNFYTPSIGGFYINGTSTKIISGGTGSVLEGIVSVQTNGLVNVIGDNGGILRSTDSNNANFSQFRTNGSNSTFVSSAGVSRYLFDKPLEATGLYSNGFTQFVGTMRASSDGSFSGGSEPYQFRNSLAISDANGLDYLPITTPTVLKVGATSNGNAIIANGLGGYQSDFSTTYTNRSWIDKGYLDSRLSSYTPSGVVLTTTDQTVSGTKTFTNQQRMAGLFSNGIIGGYAKFRTDAQLEISNDAVAGHALMSIYNHRGSAANGGYEGGVTFGSRMSDNSVKQTASFYNFFVNYDNTVSNYRTVMGFHLPDAFGDKEPLNAFSNNSVQLVAGNTSDIPFNALPEANTVQIGRQGFQGGKVRIERIGGQASIIGRTDLVIEGGDSGTGAEMYFNAYATGNVYFALGGGNSGFGKVPTAKLDVAGSARADSNDGNANTLVRNQDLLAISVTPQQVSSTSQTMSPNILYVPTSASLTTFMLPTSATFGQRFQVAGDGSGGYRIAQNAGQQIVGVNGQTTSGTTGYVQSTNSNCVITILAISSTRFKITSQQGTFTIN